jgi:phosphoribosylformimino-5-aminoimidazole carboxamide ribotide isomerase
MQCSNRRRPRRCANPASPGPLQARLSVEVYPAIDIRNGRAVRLSQGERARETVYGSDPIETARGFVAEGARWLHVVDLDRAFGTGENITLIRSLLEELGGAVKIQVSGGIRTLEVLQQLLGTAAARFVLGTAIVTDAAFLPAAIAAAGGDRLAVALDGRDGKLAIRGWEVQTGQRVDDVAARVIGEGIRTLIYTDVARDGMMVGPDIEGAVRLQQLGADVIASGGIARLADLAAVRGAGLAGAITGRAIYEGRFTVAEAVRAAAG